MGVLSKVTALLAPRDTSVSLPYECGECGTRFKQDYVECPQCGSFEVASAA